MSVNEIDDKLISKITLLMRKDDSVDAPEDSVRWAKNLFRARREPKKSFVERITAVLQMDLSPNQFVFGERSASVRQERQMLFDAAENKIDLRIKQEENGFQIYGQIFGASFGSAEVKLENQENSYKTEANELSEFKFLKISGGVYDLTLRKNEKLIIIAGLKL